MKTRSLMAMVIACGAAAAMLVPASTAEAGRKSRNDCRPSYSHRSSSHYSHGYGRSSRSNVGISVYLGTGGYSKYRGSYSRYNDCAPRYSSYSYPRYRYSACLPTYRYETCSPGVNTYYNQNYSYNTYTYPTASSGTTTYRVWQEQLATPVAQSEVQPSYPSYHPGPAQASPAPVAQMERGEAGWTTVDLSEQQRAISQGLTKAERPRHVTIGVASNETEPTPEGAWALIEAGNYAQARSAFATMTQTTPGSNEMKLGFGLANALDGRDAAAAWSLRRAVDGGMDLGVASRDGLESALERLAGVVSSRAEASGTGDSWFVLGVVQMIRGERDAAGLAVMQAMEAGDRSAAVKKLAMELGIAVPGMAGDGDT